MDTYGYHGRPLFLLYQPWDTVQYPAGLYTKAARKHPLGFADRGDFMAMAHSEQGEHLRSYLKNHPLFVGIMSPLTWQ